MAVQLEPERLVKILDVLQELPAPNYRCVGFHPLYSRDTPAPALPMAPALPVAPALLVSPVSPPLP